MAGQRKKGWITWFIIGIVAVLLIAGYKEVTELRRQEVQVAQEKVVSPKDQLKPEGRFYTNDEIKALVEQQVEARLAYIDSVKQAQAQEKARQDSLAKVKKERAQQDSLAKVYLAQVPKLKKEIVNLKKRLATLEKRGRDERLSQVVPPSLLKPVVISPTKVQVAAPAVSGIPGKKYEVNITTDESIVKFGIVADGVWTEYKPGEKLRLPPGNYAVNALSKNGVWAFDSVSLKTGKPNFPIRINGVLIEGGGRDNGVGGANGWIHIQPDGTITSLN